MNTKDLKVIETDHGFVLKYSSSDTNPVLTVQFSPTALKASIKDKIKLLKKVIKALIL